MTYVDFKGDTEDCERVISVRSTMCRVICDCQRVDLQQHIGSRQLHLAWCCGYKGARIA